MNFDSLIISDFEKDSFSNEPDWLDDCPPNPEEQPGFEMDEQEYNRQWREDWQERIRGC